MSLLDDIRDLRADFEAIRDAVSNTDRVSDEDAGIAFVCAEHGVDLTNKLELDLINDEIRGVA